MFDPQINSNKKYCNEIFTDNFYFHMSKYLLCIYGHLMFDFVYKVIASCAIVAEFHT